MGIDFKVKVYRPQDQAWKPFISYNVIASNENEAKQIVNKEIVSKEENPDNCEIIISKVTLEKEMAKQKNRSRTVIFWVGLVVVIVVVGGFNSTFNLPSSNEPTTAESLLGFLVIGFIVMYVTAFNVWWPKNRK